MNKATEKDRGTATEGRTNDPLRGNLPDPGGSVPGSCTSDLIPFVVAEISNSSKVDYLQVLDAKSHVWVFIVIDPPLRKPGAGGARYVEVGGSGGYGWTGPCGRPTGRPANEMRSGRGAVYILHMRESNPRNLLSAGESLSGCGSR